jgi:hypothetical protein
MPIHIHNIIDETGGGAAGVTAAFENGDLAAGVYVFAHTLGVQFPSITVYDNNDLAITPDDVTATNTNTASIDISSYGVIAGTWNVRGIA